MKDPDITLDPHSDRSERTATPRKDGTPCQPEPDATETSFLLSEVSLLNDGFAKADPTHLGNDDSITELDGEGTEKSLPPMQATGKAAPDPADDPTQHESLADPSLSSCSFTTHELTDGSESPRPPGESVVVRATLLGKAGSKTEGPRPADTNYAALISQEETFMAEAGLHPPAPFRPSQGFPTVPGYEIMGTLGRGGMGIVYKARHLGLRRLVALKMILHGEHASGSDLVRFRVEAEAIARLQHPNIVQVYEINEFKGLPFFSLEFVEGGTLSRKIDGTPQPIAQAAAMVETLARAMAFAHERGIIHRDLKPANVLLTADGTPKIVDFGLAKKLDEASEQTHSGAILGTPSYMAPEQADGRTREIGPATDIYALGVILYEMLIGRSPFRAEKPMDTIAMVLQEEPVPPHVLNPRVPRDLETICLKCLQKEMSKRYATATDLADDLRRFREGAPIAARPVTRTERALKWVRRRPAVAAVYGLLLLVTLLGGLGGVLGWLWHETDLQRRHESEAKQKIETALKGEQRALKREAAAKEELEQLSYIHLINLAWRDWNAGDVIRARKLVDDCKPDRRQWEWYYLQREVFAELLKLQDMAEEPLQILFSPDGKRLLTVGKDNRVREHDSFKGRDSQARENLHAQYLAYSPDGTRLAAIGPDNAVTLQDPQSGKVLQTFRGHQGNVAHLAFSPDGRHLATAGQDKTVRIWDVATGTALRTLNGHDQEVSWVAFHPKGQHLASASWDSTVKIWDIPSGKEVGSLKGHEQALTQVAFSPDGTRLATACVDKTVKLWDAATFMELPPLLGPMEDIHRLAFSPDGSRIAFAKKDKTLKVFDVFSGKQLFFLSGHIGEVTQVTYSPDGWRLASAGADGRVNIWDATTGKEMLALEGPIDNVNTLAYSPDGRRRLAAGMDRKVVIWDTDTGGKVATCVGHRDEVTDLAYHPMGQRLASAGKDGIVKIWDAQTGKSLMTIGGGSSEVARVAYTWDGTRLLSGEASGMVKGWDPLTGEQLYWVNGLAGDVLHFAVQSKGHELAVPAAKQTVLLVDSISGMQVAALKHKADIRYLAYNSDGTRLAVATSEHAVVVWDTRSRTQLFTLEGHLDDIVHMAFSPDDRCFATASLDKTVKLWDKNGAHRWTLDGHVGQVVHVAFTPDGKRLASASWDHTVKLWDVATGKELLSLPEHQEEVTQVAFSPDAGQLASVSRGGIKIWETKAATNDAWKERLYLWRQGQLAAAEEGRHWFAAVFHLNQMILHHPEHASWVPRRARAFAEQGLWEEALADFGNKATSEPVALARQALVHLARKDEASYHRCLQAALQEVLRTRAVEDALTVAGAATLLPKAAQDKLALRELATLLQQEKSALGKQTLGAIFYRLGDFPAALRSLTEAGHLAGEDGTVETRLFLAMTHHQLKNPEDAKRCLDLARQQIEQDNLNLDSAGAASWDERLRRDILAREAEALIPQ